MEITKVSQDKTFFRPWESNSAPSNTSNGVIKLPNLDHKDCEGVPKKLPKFQTPDSVALSPKKLPLGKPSPGFDDITSAVQINKHLQDLGMLYFGNNYNRSFLDTSPNQAFNSIGSHFPKSVSPANSSSTEQPGTMLPKTYTSIPSLSFTRRHMLNAWDNNVLQLSQFLNFQNSFKLPRSGAIPHQHVNNFKIHSLNGSSQSLFSPDLKKGWVGGTGSVVPGVDLARTSAKNDKKIFSCKICDKTYSSLGALKMHIRTHTLPCKCHICGKAFSRPWLLQGHIRTHTGEKPFVCNQCDRAFADRSNLRAHLQTHEDKKKFACKQENCGKTFSRASLLEKHICGGGATTEKSTGESISESGVQKTSFVVQ